MSSQTGSAWTIPQRNAVQEYLERHRRILTRRSLRMVEMIDRRRTRAAYDYMKCPTNDDGQPEPVLLSRMMTYDAAVSGIDRLLESLAK